MMTLLEIQEHTYLYVYLYIPFLFVFLNVHEGKHSLYTWTKEQRYGDVRILYPKIYTPWHLRGFCRLSENGYPNHSPWDFQWMRINGYPNSPICLKTIISG